MHKSTELIIKNARNKIQYIKIFVTFEKDCYAINRHYGQFGGKETIAPIVKIKSGKVKRSVLEQTELEFNSIEKKYLDKGYKKLSELHHQSIDKISEKDINSLLGSVKTDQSGRKKHMLAIQEEKCPTNVFDELHYASRKLDGVRCGIFYDPDLDKITSYSRGGTSYDGAIQHIINNNKLYNYLKSNPKIILDGELYRHGIPLQKLSGIARLKEYDETRCNILQFHIYDIIDEDKTFIDRLEIINKFKELFIDEEYIKVLDHYKVDSYLSVKNLHDKWVKEGYEGLIARNPNKKYGLGKRDIRMIKVKEYDEDEFEIVDISEGLRDEDMVFVCKTHAGKLFEAKPIGPRELKYQYLKDIDLLIGKKATIKFFNYSSDNIPTQPVLKTIRDYE